MLSSRKLAKDSVAEAGSVVTSHCMPGIGGFPIPIENHMKHRPIQIDFGPWDFKNSSIHELKNRDPQFTLTRQH
jgi:hypothetical protein